MATNGKIKLSGPQTDLLKETAQVDSQYVWENYLPAKALVKKGFCEWVGTYLKVTQAGKDWLKEGDK